jgi:hypothetical protein
MQAHAALSTAARVVIDDLCKDLSRRIERTVRADYGMTDCGSYHDAALCVQSLPDASWGQPGPLVSIVAGPGSPGGFVVLAADGSPLAEGVDLGQAVRTARMAGVRRYRQVVKG